MSMHLKQCTTISLIFIILFAFPASSVCGASIKTKAVNKPYLKLYGVNRSGAEFASEVIPGKLGVDFEYPTDKAKFEAFAAKGLTLIRIPILWERVQPKAKSGLNMEALFSILTLLDNAESANVQIILDLHNYGRYYNIPLEVKHADYLSNFWVTLITAIGNKPALYGIELMNEPHDLPGGGEAWANIAQQTVTAVRQYNNNVTILVPGYSWQSAHFWPENNKSLIISDPANKILYSAHQYFDSNYSGTYQQPTQGNVSYGSELIIPFIQWLKEKNVKGIITEYGVPSKDKTALGMMRNMLQLIDNSEVLIGAIYWASGPRWGDYPLSVEPDKYGNFPEQINVLQDFPTRTNPISIPAGVKPGNFVKFAKNPTTYFIDVDGLHPLSSNEVYLNYKNKNKSARLYTRLDKVSNYTVRFTPLSNIGN